jgi:hypothetical protein
MSKITRILILATTVAVLNLAGLTAVAHAQTNNQDTPSQQELAERWNSDYCQATHMSPTQHKAWLQANAAQRELSDRWADYSHATQMSPAELKAWAQAQDRAGTPTAKTVQVPAPVRPDQPSGQPLWLVVTLGMLATAGNRRWAGPAGRPARQPQGSSRARDLAPSRSPTRWGCRAHRQPHRLAVSHGTARLCGDPVTTSHLRSLGNGRPLGRFAAASPAQL